jgi:hypothetical protein
MVVMNPFVYGEIVAAGAFTDRDGERERLTRDLAAGQKVFLISPRRYGKSSLIRDVLKRLAQRRVLTVEVTVAASSSYVGFLESYARALIAANTPAGRIRRWASELLQVMRPEVRLETQREIPHVSPPRYLRYPAASLRPANKTSPSRSTSSRPSRRSTAARSNTPCAPPCRRSETSVTSSPAPNRR